MAKILVVKKLVVRFWILFVLGVSLSITFFYGIENWGLLGEMPSTKQLENPKFFQASEIYSSDAKLIGTYYTQNRINIEYNELPAHLIQALVSTEDKRYYEHSGIDFHGLLRAVVGAFVGGKGGGSTISQQLAKQLFTVKPNQNVVLRIGQKFKEWVMAVKLERLYTKEEILTMYFNIYNFHNSAVGVYNASRVYFNKNLKNLTIEESASLVAMFKSPVRYNPLKFSKDNTRSLDRRNVVMKLMANAGYITDQDFDSLKLIPVGSSKIDISDRSEYAAYFKENVRGFMKKWAKENDYNLYTDGLKIYTTIDSRMQAAAEKGMIKHLSTNLQPAFVKEWKKRKNGPFYFNTGDKQKENEKLQGILFRGMHQSDRYKKVYYRQKDLIESYSDYRNLHVPYLKVIDSLERYKGMVHEKEFELNLLKRKDTLKYYENDLIEKYQEELDDILDQYEDYVKDAEDLKEEVSEAYNEYQKILKPFDDSMKVVFSKKVEMKIFTWKGSKKVKMSPLDSIYHHKKFLKAGLLSVDSETGHVKAWVGGINHGYFKYDHIKAKRQAGSSFKPFIYAAAIEYGMDPSTTILNKEVTFHKGEYGIPTAWTPSNSGKGNLEYELITLKTGLAKSINWVAAGLTKKMGVYTAIEFARRFGIEGRLEPVPSICLGTADVSLWEMVGAYTAFSNKGERFEPVTILRIEDKNGKVLYKNKPQKHKVLSEASAEQMLTLMEGNTQSYEENGVRINGTGQRLRRNYPYGNFSKDIPISGKTGTTQNSSDGWYIGICKNLVTGVWVGCEDRSAHFRNGALGQGANMALPIWGYYMKKAIKVKN